MQLLSCKLEATVPFEEDSIDSFLKLCEESIKYITSNDRVQYRLKSAIHELVINSLEHGYKRNAGKISIVLKREGQRIILRISDEGSGLKPSTVRRNRHHDSIDSLTMRGWGLILTSKLSNGLRISKNKPSGTVIYVSFTE